MFNLSLFVGLRYTLSRKQSHLVAFISRVSTAAMVLAVALLITVSSVMNGFDKELREQILAIVPHATLSGFSQTDDWQAMVETAESFEHVEHATPYSHLQALLMHKETVKSVLIYGLDEGYEPRDSMLRTLLSDTLLQQLSIPNSVILGRQLAKKLQVSVGSDIRLMIPQRNRNAIPQSQVFKVIGLLESGSELDEKIALAHLDTIALLKKQSPGTVDGIRLYVDDLFQAKRIAAEISQVLPLFYIRDWSQTHGNLFQAVQMSRKLVFLLVLVIVAVAAFNVVSTLVIAVNDKARDIAILKTLGCSQRQILAIFMMQGSIIGTLGVLLGVLLGLFLSMAVSAGVEWLEHIINYQFLHTDVYPIDHLPADIRWQSVLAIAVIALSLSILATIFPALQASRLKPAQVLRYE